MVVDLDGQEALIMGKKKKQVASICIGLVENYKKCDMPRGRRC